MSKSDPAAVPWRLLRPYVGRFAALSLVICFGAVVEAAGLVLLSGLLNTFFASSGAGPSLPLLEPLYRSARANPPAFLLLLVGVYLLKSLLAIAGTYGSFSLALRITQDWQVRLVSSFLHVPLGLLDTRQGSMVQIVLDETGSAALGLGAAGLLAQNVLSTLTVYAVLLYISPWVTLGLTIMAMVAAAMVAVISRLSVKLGQARYRIFMDGYSHMTELASAIKQFRALGLEPKAESESAAHFARMRGMQLKLNMIGASPRLLIELLFLCGLAASIFVLAPRMGDVSVLSTIALAVMATVRLLPSFTTSASTWVQVQQARPAIAHIGRELQRLKPISGSAARTGRPAVFQDAITVRDVSFGHPGRESALIDANLDIRRGAVIAIAGTSGSGKSTLVDLICGFYEPDSGQVCIDGMDLRSIDIASWRKQLGVVLQDSFLMNGTIRENLCLLRPDCPQSLLDETVKLVGADVLIRDLPEGYETRVGDRGVGLSGGQRQRLAIARVLLREPAVLVLDEAMSALDMESEESLQRTMGNLRGGTTLIVISHRLSALRRADYTYVLDGGRVVESGRHDELILRGGVYAGMWATSHVGTDERPLASRVPQQRVTG